jgi:hypothetical protein
VPCLIAADWHTYAQPGEEPRPAQTPRIDGLSHPRGFRLNLHSASTLRSRIHPPGQAALPVRYRGAPERAHFDDGGVTSSPTHPHTPPMPAETASSSGVVVAEAEVEVEVEMPNPNAVRSHWVVVTAFTHVASYKYKFQRKKSVHPMHLSVSVTLVASSATVQIPGMSQQTEPIRRRQGLNMALRLREIHRCSPYREQW